MYPTHPLKKKKQTKKKLVLIGHSLKIVGRHPVFKRNNYASTEVMCGCLNIFFEHLLKLFSHPVSQNLCV